MCIEFLAIEKSTPEACSPHVWADSSVGRATGF
jgi:hypothetical protein